MSVPSQSSAKPVVFVIDDDPVIRITAREYIEQAGFECQEATNGRAGLAAFEALRPDIVLLDVMMPDLDGFTVCARLRGMSSGGAHVPILMVTGNDDLESIDRAYEVGATDFAVKPINYPLLMHRIRYMLRAEQTTNRLRESQHSLNHAQRIAKLGSWELELVTNRLQCSEKLLDILALDMLSGRVTFATLFNAIHHDDRDNVETAVRCSLQDGHTRQSEFRILTADGTQTIVHQEVEGVTDEGGRVTRLVGTIQDITERRDAEQRIRELAYYDNVTGLPNRILLNEHLSQALVVAERYHRPVAVLFIDLDHFKRINDTWGHTVGDQLLRMVAARLAECLRGCDIVARHAAMQHPGAATQASSPTVARLGGDEFVVLLPELRNTEDAAIVARRIIDALSEPFTVERTEVLVTASIGISAYPTDGDDAEALLKQADGAMYEAKDKGRNGYQFYTAGTQARALERLNMEASLRRALDTEQFVLHYQPKVSLRTGEVVGMEALVRWNSPELGLVSPADFIPIAEETGLIVALGKWVLETACAQTKRWQFEGLDSLCVSVNLSAAQFGRTDLIDMVSGSLVANGLEPKFLELELTESLLMEDVDSHIEQLQGLRAVGVKLSIDDFGTGYSSLSYLKRFPIHTLKIDRLFIRDMEFDEDDVAIVKGAIALAHSLRLSVVAEGVENQAQQDILQTCGCDAVQGFFYCRPVPVDEFPSRLKTISIDCSSRSDSRIGPRLPACSDNDAKATLVG